MISEVNLKTVSTLVAISGLVFGIVKFIQVQEIEAARPYLERKLAWCEEAVETTSAIAVSGNVTGSEAKRFREMYWGVMGLVERDAIVRAMKGFDQSLDTGGDLEQASLALAHACRTELANDWSSSWAR